MGFYGHMTARTQFQFDRTYCNRNEMETNVKKDGVYAGRYVLVEYDNNHYPIVYLKDEGVYTSASLEEVTRIKIASKISNSATAVLSGTRVRVYDPDNTHSIEHDLRVEGYSIYKLVGEVGDYAQLAQLTEEEKKDDPHYYNYNQDKKYAEALGEQIGRGWDSTVWQKIYAHGDEKYVMIAELNSVVPTFRVSADAPSMFPIAPHFDVRSTNVNYLMHQQPQWGFRVKAANGKLIGPVLDDKGNPVANRDVNYSTNQIIYPSDEKTTWLRTEYDKDTDAEKVYYYNGNSWETNKVEKGVDAAIYYNKAGFNSQTESMVDLSDEINITPTGQSGHEYNAHDQVGGQEAREDIQELTIMLPSIGNSISEMWNVIYGGNAVGTGERNRDVEWNSTKGHRMLQPVQGIDGYTYAPKETETVAGVINSVHDLMGMIIKDDYDPMNNNELPEDMDKIYYYNNKFYRKARDYKYNSAEYTYKKVILTEDIYTPNYYYYKSGNNYIADINMPFDASKDYYVRQLNRTTAKPLIINEELYEYNKNTFYTLNEKDYILSIDEEYNKYNTYYKIKNSISRTFSKNYEPGRYYVKTNTNPIRYELLNGIFDGQKVLYDLTFEAITDGSLPFVAGKYYTQATANDGSTTFSPAMVYDDTKIYFRKNPTPTAQDKSEFLTVKLFNLETGNYYEFSENNYIQTQNPNLSSYYKLINSVEYAEHELYTSNTYYYLTNGNYKLGISNTALSNTTYYSLEFEKIEYFYEPYKYLYKEGSSFLVDTNAVMTSGRNYYLPIEYYVISDSTGIANKYSKWNNNVENVPCTIELGTREESHKMIELKGFGKSLNTIHGLILEVNHMLETREYEHRDDETAKGLMNQIKDIIYQFGELNPRDLVLIDDYGRMHSGALIGDNWISASVDGNVSSANVEIKHKAPTKVSIDDKSYDFNTSGNKFSFTQNAVDETGHISGTSNVSITMPNSIKKFEVSTDGNTFSKTANSPVDSCSFGIKGDEEGISTSLTDNNIILTHKNKSPISLNFETNTISLAPGDEVLQSYNVIGDNYGHVKEVSVVAKKLPKYTLNTINPDVSEGTEKVPLVTNIEFNNNNNTQIDVTYYDIKPLQNLAEENSQRINENTNNLKNLTIRVEIAEENILSSGAAIHAITIGSNMEESGFDLTDPNTDLNFKHQISLNKVFSKSKGADDSFILHKSSSNADLVSLKIRKSGLYEISGSVYLKLPKTNGTNELARPGCYIQKIEYSDSEQAYVYTELNSAIIISPLVVDTDLVVSTGSKIVYLNAGEQIGLFARMSSSSENISSNWICYNNNNATYLTIRALGEQDSSNDLSYDN